MKKNYAMASLAFFIFMGLQAQFVDDIESYPTGSIFTDRWTTWNGLDDGLQNAEVSTDFAASETKSIKIGPGTPGPGPQDAILDFQGAATSGIWNAKWLMYIPSGHSAYFNVQGNTDPNAEFNSQYLSGNITFNGDNFTPGLAFDDNSGFEFAFPHDSWFLVGVEVNIDSELLTLNINGEVAADFFYYDFAERFDGIDFYSVDDFALFYIDNVEFGQGPLVLETEPPVASCVGSLTLDLDENGQVTLDPQMIDNGSTDNSGQVFLSVNPSTLDCSNIGATTVTLIVTDPSGNTDECTTTVTVSDVTDPLADCVAPFTIQLGATGTVTISAEDIDNASSDACGIDTISLDVDTFDCTDLGDNTVNLTITDVNGNSTNCQTTVTITTFFECPAAITVPTDAGICMATNVNIGVPMTSESCAPITSVINDAPTQFNTGTTTVTWTVTYDSGDVQTCTQDVTVVDMEAPSLTCPADITVSVPSGETYAVPDYFSNGDVTVIENCSLGGNTGQVPSPNTQLSPGTFTVVITAEDVSGNEVDCSFILTVDEILSTTDFEISEFVISPNPTNGSLQIENRAGSTLEVIYLYDVSGRLVKEIGANLDSNKITLDIDHLASGVYLMILQTEDARITKKIVKK